MEDMRGDRSQNPLGYLVSQIETEIAASVFGA